MNQTTEKVTLYATFISDILNIYENKRENYRDLFKIVEGYDLSDPFKPVPFELYNQVCSWIEINLGNYSLIQAGRKIGETAFKLMIQKGLVGKRPSPQEVMQGLIQLVNQVVFDPQNRGWEIIKSEPKQIHLRKTLDFNNKLQEGFLHGLLLKSGVSGIRVTLVKDIQAGDLYDEYLLSWF